MRVRGWIWDERNRAHIARHRMYEDEAEEVAETASLSESVEAGKLLAWGKTAEGRYLLVVYTIRKGYRGYVITARDMTANEKKRLHKLLKERNSNEEATNAD